MNIMFKDELTANIQYYEKLSKRFPPSDYRGLGWSSRKSQEERFSILKNFIEEDDISLLDVGCGAADLLEYLKQSNLKIEYVGCDLMESNIKHCQEKYPDAKFMLGDFLSMKIDRSFDYVVASGIFVFPSDNWNNLFYNFLEKMMMLSTKAVCLNLLSSLYDNKFKSVHYVEPWEILKIVASFSNKFQLLHHYSIEGNNFSVCIYK